MRGGLGGGGGGGVGVESGVLCLGNGGLEVAEICFGFCGILGEGGGSWTRFARAKAVDVGWGWERVAARGIWFQTLTFSGAVRGLARSVSGTGRRGGGWVRGGRSPMQSNDAPALARAGYCRSAAMW